MTHRATVLQGHRVTGLHQSMTPVQMPPSSRLHRVHPHTMSNSEYESDSSDDAKGPGHKEMDMDRFYEDLHQSDDDVYHGNSEESNLDSFNLNKELESGAFDEHGNYIEKKPKKSDNEEEDKLYDVEAKEIELAKLAHGKRQNEAKMAKRRDRDSAQSLDEILLLVINSLEPAETCLEKLQSLKGAKDKIYTLTNLASRLIEKNVVNVYDLSREELIRMWSKETGKEFSRPANKRTSDDIDHEESQWHFRWIGDETLYGPYSLSEMVAWKTAEYFQGNAEVRKVGTRNWENVDVL